MSDGPAGGNSRKRINAELFALDDEWRSIDRKTSSIRGFLLIPGFFQKIDLVEASRELQALQDRLEAVPRLLSVGITEESGRKLDDYRVSLSASIRLLIEICELEDRSLWRGDRSCSRELNEKTMRYRKVQSITRMFRKELSTS